MNALVVFAAVVVVVAAGPSTNTKREILPFNFNNGAYQPNQAYYPGYPANLYRGYYPGYQQGYYPGYQGYQGYYPGYQGYQGFYPGYQGYNRGYYPVAPAPAVYPSVAPAPAYVAPYVPKVSPVPPVYKPVDGRTPAIVRQSQDSNADGSFRYGFETENGIVAQATGYLKPVGPEGSQVIEGSYSYPGDDGVPVEVKYYADETGYHAVGNVVPSTPPEIAKSLELIAQQPQKPEDSKKK